jgi:uncharacterized protein (TIGR02996 family)
MNEEAGFLKALAEGPGDESARLAFADWLEERGDPRALWARDTDLFPFTKAMRQDPLPGLVAALGEKGTWETVLRGLVKLGEPVVPSLLGCMRTDNSDVREHARQVMGLLGPAAVGCLPELQGMLSAEDVPTLRAAAEMLARLGPAAAPALPRLLELLEYESIVVRTEVAGAIAELKSLPSSVLPALQAAYHRSFDDEDYDEGDRLRYEIVRAFGAVGKAALEVVPELARSFITSGEVAEEAAAVLTGLGLEVVGPLLAQAEHIDTEEYEYAVQALVDLGPEVVPVLVRELADPEQSGEAKAIVARALGDERLVKHFGEHAPAVVEQLAAGLKDANWLFAREAAWALGELGQFALPAAPALRDALHRDDLSRHAAGALARLGEANTGLGPLAEEVRHPKVERRQQAVHALRPLAAAGDEALPHLLHALRDADASVRWSAAHVLAETMRPHWVGALEPLRAALRDDDASVRTWCASAIGKLGQAAAAALPDLLGLLGAAEDNIRAAAAEAVAHIAPGSQAAVDTIRAALNDPSPTVRHAAVRGLRAFPTVPDRLIHVLGERLVGADAAFASEACGLLADLQPTPASGITVFRMVLQGGYEHVRRQAVESLQRMGARARELIPELLAALEGEDRWVGYGGACAIASMGPEGLRVLVDCFSDTREHVRERAAASLVSAGPLPSSVLPLLLDAAAHPDAKVRQGVAAALGNAVPGTEEALPALRKLLNDQGPGVRWSALHSLGKFGPAARPALPELLLLLSDGRLTWRASVIDLLMKLEAPAGELVPHLRQALRDFYASVRAAAARALGALGPEAKAATPDLRALANDLDGDVRHSAAEALAKLEGRGG